MRLPAIKLRRNGGQAFAWIGINDRDRGSDLCTYRFVAENRDRTLRNRIFHERGAIEFRTGQGRKQIARLHRAAVGGYAKDLWIGA